MREREGELTMEESCAFREGGEGWSSWLVWWAAVMVVRRVVVRVVVK